MYANSVVSEQGTMVIVACACSIRDIPACVLFTHLGSVGYFEERWQWQNRWNCSLLALKQQTDE